MSYELSIESCAQRDLAELPADVRARVEEAIDALTTDPRPFGYVALRGGRLKGSFRVHVGRDYVIGYDVDDSQRLVEVWQIGNRRSFYAKAKRRRR